MSIGKTQLGLNQWTKDESPKMDEFNSDNRVIDEQLRGKVDQTACDSALSAKADLTYVNSALADKVDQTELESFVDKPTMESALAGKVDQQSLEQLARQIGVYTAENSHYMDGKHVLTGALGVMPDFFTVRFQAPADFTEGDQIEINGRLFDVYRSDLTELQTGAFAAGCVVSLNFDQIGRRAFFQYSGGNGTGMYAILPSQTKIVIESYYGEVSILLDSINSDAYAGTRLVCKKGGEMPESPLDGSIYEAGNDLRYVFTDLEYGERYTIRAFAYNHDGAFQTDIVNAVISVTPEEEETYIPQLKWISSGRMPRSKWAAVTYGDGLFVAVDNPGSLIGISMDGITWTTTPCIVDSSWTGITYGGGLFVAVASEGECQVMTSPDGENWTRREAAAVSSWQNVVYGNGLFVAVANNGECRVMTSADGITWTRRETAFPGSWYDVAYGNGTYVAVARAVPNYVMSSPDGIHWTLREAPTGCYCVTYGNGMFIAAGSGVMTSPNGINWTIRPSGVMGNWTSIAYGNGLYTLLTARNNTTPYENHCMLSADGINWYASGFASSRNYTSVAFGNDRFVVVESVNAGSSFSYHAIYEGRH